MSHEGVSLLARVILVVGLLMVAAVLHAIAGPSRRRGRIMVVGTVGGFALGVLISSLIRGMDLSSACAIVGILIGWGVAWRFARRIPREA